MVRGVAHDLNVMKNTRGGGRHRAHDRRHEGPKG